MIWLTLQPQISTEKRCHVEPKIGDPSPKIPHPISLLIKVLQAEQFRLKCGVIDTLFTKIDGPNRSLHYEIHPYVTEVQSALYRAKAYISRIGTCVCMCFLVLQNSKLNIYTSPQFVCFILCYEIFGGWKFEHPIRYNQHYDCPSLTTAMTIVRAMLLLGQYNILNGSGKRTNLKF